MSKRTGYLTLLLLVFFVVISVAEDSSRPSLKAGKNWPLYRGDALSSGVARTMLPEKPDPIWKYEVKNGAFESTAAIVDGVVYIGDMDGNFHCVSASTGKLR